MKLSGEVEIERYGEQDALQWDEFCAASKTPLFLFERPYMDYHADRFLDHSLMISIDGRLVALLPANRAGNDIYTHGGLTYGGLITSISIRAPEILQIFKAIGEYYRRLGVVHLIYKAVPSVFRRYPADEDLYALTQVGATLVRRDLSSVVKLSQRPKLNDARKSTARKASKAGATICELGDLAPFHDLLASVLAKFDAKPVHSLHEMELLRSRFPTKIRFFGVMLNETLLAGTVVYDFGYIVHTQYLAASHEGRLIGALDFLLVNLIESFGDRDYFSFGISTEENGTVLNEGLIRQKEGFGGRGIVHDFYKWVL